MADAPVFRLGNRKVTGDAEASQRVMDAIIPLLEPFIEEVGRAAILDGLASLYVSLAVGWLGEARAADALSRYREALPRIAASQRAMRGEGGYGRA